MDGNVAAANMALRGQILSRNDLEWEAAKDATNGHCLPGMYSYGWLRNREHSYSSLAKQYWLRGALDWERPSTFDLELTRTRETSCTSNTSKGCPSWLRLNSKRPLSPSSWSRATMSMPSGWNGQTRLRRITAAIFPSTWRVTGMRAWVFSWTVAV